MPFSVPLDEQRSARQLFGSGSGYVHPLLSVSEKFTDNYYLTADDEKSEFITTVSPGLWLALPAARQPLSQTPTSSRAPGGLQLSRLENETGRRIQAHALYRAGIEELRNFPADNMVTHQAEGLIRYNFRGGLAMELLDIHHRDHEDYDTGLERTELDKFSSNLGSAVLTYQFSPKFRLRGDYSRYTIRYDADRNAYRERADDDFALYVFYKLLPKTSIFTEYEFIDIDYRENAWGGSVEHHYFTGLDWNVTEKSRGRVKVGYGVKDFDYPRAADRGDVLFEAQINHRFTRKASMLIRFVRRTRESDQANSQDVLTSNLQLGYTQNLTAKFAASIKATYIHDSYSEELALADKTAKLGENYYVGDLTLAYAFRDWLNLEAQYVYRDRDSNFAPYDYRCQAIYLKLDMTL